MAQKRRNNRNNRNSKRFLAYQENYYMHFSVWIFVIVFIYIAIVIFNYATKKQTGIYEVKEGSNNAASEYTAFIYRDERVYSAAHTGYVNYYLEPGNRTRKGSTVCTLDETGDFLKHIVTEASSGSHLSNDTLSKFKNLFNDLSGSFTLDDYSTLYTSKNDINAQLLELLAAEGISEYKDASDAYSFAIVSSTYSGIFSNVCDGYEKFTLDNLNKSILDTTSYSPVTRYSGNEVEQGSFLYKIIPDDKFSIIFQMSDEDLVTYWENTTLTVYFPDIDENLTGDFSFIFDADGNRYCKVDFDSHGFNLANTRYTDIELKGEEVSGLEIPVSSLTSMDLFIIPKDYIVMGSNDINKSTTVLMETTDAEGNTVQMVKKVTIVDEDGDNYIILNDDDLVQGTKLCKADSTDYYLVGATKSVQGVYSVNKGYAEFKPVYVIYTFEEGYVIVTEGVSYSIAQYDHIALNASLISQKEIIY